VLQTCGITALVTAMATIFKPNWAPYTSPLYAATKGFTLGLTSFILERWYPGIAMSAVLLTVGTAAGLLAAHRARLLTVTDRFRSIITTAFMGVMFSFLGFGLLRMVGVNFEFLSAGPVATAISLGMTALAASCLLLDFDGLERMERMQVPKWFEWYGGFTVLITLLWLYVQILQLLARFQSRDD
jgi:uncharacterized YccA/Bax inhibitor family protein